MPPSTPKQLGYRMPAEWEPHAATWLSWPHKLESWPGKFEPIPLLYAELVRTLSRFEPVHINAGGSSVMRQAKELVGHLPNVFLHDIPTNDAWCRDHGPTFLVGPAGSQPALVNWNYNAWGGKYPPFDLDDQVPTRIAAIQNRRVFTPNIFMEGGAIDVNGRGTVLTTEECLLNPNRNPTLSKQQVERYLCDYLGVSNVLWLGRGIVGDDTDGHIDELARFVNPTTVVAPLEENRDDENYEPLRENFERLQSMRDQDGKRLTVVPLPMPAAIFHEDQRLPACYCNFCIANGVVIVPQFDDPADAQAIEVLRPFFPDRQVIGLPARDLVWGLGAFHCISQQEPAN
ncbi:MAG: agmatine deiminase family protein [Planctomycetota bacterium]|nr:agmatine deiminase family protein [Planctomycetota bacterium]